ncbi:hypothetical protein SK128_007354 [Halocaridina rubra]|uniref:Ionotropic glutamate receptor C-terminal domain-containing protein n=1 Tax=Halocaridina rubra TaxID=373956 RepID=A0AAN8WNN1_HALRR
MSLTNEMQRCLKFAAVHYPPHVIRLDRSLPITGWAIDAAKMIAEHLGYCYEIIPQEVYGIKLPNGSFTGILGMVNRQEIDMTVTPLAITPTRAEAGDFSDYLFMDQQDIIYKRPVAEADMSGFTKPFSGLIWSLILASLLINITATFIVMWSKSQIDHKRESRKDKKPKQDITVFSAITRAVFWTIQTLVSQSTTWNPKGVPVRTLTGIWLFVCLIFGTVYRSNLSAMLILPKIQVPFNNLEELLTKTSLDVFIIQDSMFYYAMMTAPANTSLGKLRKRSFSGYDLTKATFDVMRGKYPAVCAHTGALTILHYDFSEDGSCFLYTTHQNGLFRGVVTGWAFPKKSTLKPKVDKLIARLREGGIIDYLQRRYVINATECLKPVGASKPSAARVLELKDFYGVFLIYFGGT